MKQKKSHNIKNRSFRNHQTSQSEEPVAESVSSDKKIMFASNMPDDIRKKFTLPDFKYCEGTYKTIMSGAIAGYNHIINSQKEQLQESICLLSFEQLKNFQKQLLDWKLSQNNCSTSIWQENLKGIVKNIISTYDKNVEDFKGKVGAYKYMDMRPIYIAENNANEMSVRLQYMCSSEAVIDRFSPNEINLVTNPFKIKYMQAEHFNSIQHLYNKCFIDGKSTGEDIQNTFRAIYVIMNQI